jgi:hypothetical protein
LCQHNNKLPEVFFDSFKASFLLGATTNDNEMPTMQDPFTAVQIP